MADRPIVVAVTGASGAPYAVRLLETLIDRQQPVSLIVLPVMATRDPKTIRPESPMWRTVLPAIVQSWSAGVLSRIPVPDASWTNEF